MLISNLKKEENPAESEDDINYDNLCYICYDEINNDSEKVVLSCNHHYHYQCVLLVFKSNNGKKQCPYCRSPSGYLPLKPGMLPIKNIHAEYKKDKNVPINFIPGRCKHILKRGPKAGNQCSLKIKYDSGYCRIHHKKYLEKESHNSTLSNPSNSTSSIHLVPPAISPPPPPSVSPPLEIYDSDSPPIFLQSPPSIA